jgi:hypothetical protein
MQDFTSVEQLFGNNQPQLANPEKQPFWHSLTNIFSNLTNKFHKGKSKKMTTRLNKGKRLQNKKTKIAHLKSWQKILLIFLLLFALLLSVLVSYSYFRVRKMLALANSTKIIVMESADLAKTQNLPALPSKISSLKENINALDSEYQALAIYKYLPITRRYYSDGEIAFAMAHKGVNLVEQIVNVLLPYSDVLGFQGEGSFEGGTTQDRIVLILETLEEIQPAIDEIEDKLKEIEELSQKIDANHYPEKVAEYVVRQQIIDAQEQITQAIHGFGDYKPIIAELGKMAGAKESQKYLILFQNDNELRPTGGFLTAYSIVQIDKGTVIPEKSGDIYDLDLKFRENIPIPEELGKYLTTERYWNLRDMNIYPDFKKSMETFYQYYQTVPGEPDDIDGIIAVDTQVLTWLLEVIGPVQIPGYGTFSAEIDQRCDCPQVVYALSEIITRPTNYIKEDRKGVLGPLMSAILSKTYELDKAKFPELFTLATNSLKGRHLQLYFVDESSQLAAEKINAAGKLYELPNNFKDWQFGQNQDFLAVINANLGGAKSNLFIDYEMKLSVDAPLDGYINDTLEITYRNSAKADNCNLEAGLLCLNATLNDWIRIYLPPGAELIEIQGLEEEAEVYEEEGYTVVDGFFKLEPLGLARIRMTYRVPYQDQENYNLRLWKQGGINPVPVLIEVTGGEEELLMNRDLDYSTIF